MPLMQRTCTALAILFESLDINPVFSGIEFNEFLIKVPKPEDGVNFKLCLLVSRLPLFRVSGGIPAGREHPHTKGGPDIFPLL